MKTPYAFSVLRYVHDVVTGEFVNVGVVVFAPRTGFLSARCTSHFRRAAQLFGGIDGGAFRRVTRFVESEINRVGRDFPSLVLGEEKIESVLARVLPPDDSAMQFSKAGAGLSEDPERTLDELYDRFVGDFEKVPTERRTDEDVWRCFRQPLAQKGVVQHLHPKRIVAPNYKYEFKHSWKNAHWHALEPMSFDLADEDYILEKASRWLGRMTSLEGASESVKLHVLLGTPQERRLKPSFDKAQNLLHKMPGEHEFHSESEAEQVADWVKSEVTEHDDAISN